MVKFENEIVLLIEYKRNDDIFFMIIIYPK